MTTVDGRDAMNTNLVGPAPRGNCNIPQLFWLNGRTRPGHRKRNERIRKRNERIRPLPELPACSTPSVPSQNTARFLHNRTQPNMLNMFAVFEERI